METSRDRRAPIVRALIAVSASLALLVTAISAVVTVQWVQLRNLGTDDGFPRDGVGPSGDPGPSPGSCTQRACTYLLLGSDSRAGLPSDRYDTNEDIGGTTRADTIMLVHTDPRRQAAVVLSFPRDLWVRIPGRGFDRINSAFEGGVRHGGPQLMARTISDLTGLRVDHYLFVDLAGFRDVVDTIGGVDMCVPAYNVNTPGWLPATTPEGEPTQVYVADVGHIADPNAGLNIEPGCQRLDGEDSLAYVRARHLPCDHIPDFARIGRQQQFLRALVNQMLRPSKIVQAPALVPQVLEHLRRDRSFLPSDLVNLVGELRGLGTGAVDFRAVPGVAAFEGTKSVVKMDASAEGLFAALRHGDPIGDVGSQLEDTPPSEANTIVAVLDAGSGGKAAQVERILAEGGFDITPGVRDQAPGEKRSAILFRPGSEAHARVVASYFPNLPVIGPSEIADADVAVVVTGSYEHVPPGTTGGESTGDCPSTTA